MQTLRLVCGGFMCTVLLSALRVVHKIQDFQVLGMRTSTVQWLRPKPPAHTVMNAFLCSHLFTHVYFVIVGFAESLLFPNVVLVFFSQCNLGRCVQCVCLPVGDVWVVGKFREVTSLSVGSARSDRPFRQYLRIQLKMWLPRRINYKSMPSDLTYAITLLIETSVWQQSPTLAVWRGRRNPPWQQH
jgi:hypothetical protein